MLTQPTPIDLEIQEPKTGIPAFISINNPAIKVGDVLAFHLNDAAGKFQNFTSRRGFIDVLNGSCAIKLSEAIITGISKNKPTYELFSVTNGTTLQAGAVKVIVV
jgi:hypothetical protein